jgi:hypothetical protein
MSSFFHHELGMWVKDRVGLRPGIGDSPSAGREERAGQLGVARGTNAGRRARRIELLRV